MRSLLLNGAGLAASIVFVFFVIAGVSKLHRKGLVSASSARKAIHIALSNWWLIAMAMFDDPWTVSVGPACSFLAAIFFPHLMMLPSAGSGGRRDKGTIFYSAALLVLVNLSWRGVIPSWIGGLGALVMGWGDGCAGLVGVRFGRAGIRIWGRMKTVEGTATMFLASFAVVLVLTLVFKTRSEGLPRGAIISLSTAAVATALELFTPLGIDNLTISLGTALFYAGAFA
jgi:phytol kinase